MRVVFLLDPGPLEKPNLVWAAENGVVSTLLRFDDPGRLPELYDPALRFDRHHVSKAGAAIYTREIARRILASGEPAAAAEPLGSSVIFTEGRFFLFFVAVFAALLGAASRAARRKCCCSPRASCSTARGTGASSALIVVLDD